MNTATKLGTEQTGGAGCCRFSADSRRASPVRLAGRGLRPGAALAPCARRSCCLTAPCCVRPSRGGRGGAVGARRTCGPAFNRAPRRQRAITSIETSGPLSPHRPGRRARAEQRRWSTGRVLTPHELPADAGAICCRVNSQRLEAALTPSLSEELNRTENDISAHAPVVASVDVVCVLAGLAAVRSPRQRTWPYGLACLGGRGAPWKPRPSRVMGAALPRVRDRTRHPYEMEAAR